MHRIKSATAYKKCTTLDAYRKNKKSETKNVKTNEEAEINI